MPNLSPIRLKPGYGHTIGNSLRRVLLSSLEGAAITSIKVEGAMHEFATIEGVVEDVTDIVLNLKSVKFKAHCRENRPSCSPSTGKATLPPPTSTEPEHRVGQPGQSARWFLQLVLRHQPSAIRLCSPLERTNGSASLIAEPMPGNGHGGESQ